MKQRPLVFLDIKSRKAHPYSRRVDNVNLSESFRRFRILGFLKWGLSLLVAGYFVIGFALAPNSADLFAASNINEQDALEQELAELEAQIVVQSNLVNQYKQKGNTLQSEIDRMNAEIDQLNRQIQVIILTLEKLGNEIVETEGNIVNTESQLQDAQKAVVKSLQYMYEKDQESLVVVLLKNPNLSDFFGEFNDLLDVQNTLSSRIREMLGLRDNLLEEKEILALQKDDAIALAKFQRGQKNIVLSTKKQKDELLEAAQGNEKVWQEALAKTKQSAAEIRKRIFKLLGGGEMTFEEAYQFAKYSENLTNTPAPFLLAILDNESRLGHNVGKCTYRNAMAPGPPTSRRDDITPFLQITAELGLDPNTTPVSCAISTDGAYGGAMGPSQFIPTTWMYYKDRISKLTGNNPASPWRNEDAFVATGLYIADAMNSCSQYGGIDQQRCAAARYYAGGNWRTHLYTYGERVISKSRQFTEDIKVISR